MARRDLSSAQFAVVQAVRMALAGGDDGPARVEAVRVACSGGADSLALAAGLAWLDGHAPDPLRMSSALVVDHGLQPGSADVAEAVVDVLRGLGLEANSVRVNVVVGPDGLEAAARDARYSALAEGDIDRVLVGHTMDDQAETVLLGLARGSGTRSLAGMPSLWRVGHGDGSVGPGQRNRPHGPGSHARSVVFVRPLLGLRRAVTRQACADWGLAPWDDPMNDDERYARVRARRLLPLVEQSLGPGVVEALARTAALARADADHLDDAAAVRLGTDDGVGVSSLPVPVVAQAPEALRGRVIRAWLVRQEITELSFERTQAVLALVNDWHGQAGVDLPGGHRVVRRDGTLRLE